MPCIKCNNPKVKVKKSSLCATCYNEPYHIKFRNSNRELLSERTKQWIAANPERALDTKRKHAYGVGNEWVALILVAQNYMCGICCSDITNSYRIDHCHSTGKARGLLCNKCNSGLHYVELTDFVEKARKYLTERIQDGIIINRGCES